jgi:WD40 repeat protein
MLVWKAHKGRVRSLAFSPDGTRIASTAGNSKFVWHWDATSGKSAGKLSGDYYDAVRALAFFPDGQHLAAHMESSGIRIWDISSGQVVAMLANPGLRPDALAVSPTADRLLACAICAVSEWNEPARPTGDKLRAEDRLLVCLHRGTTRLAYSPLGTWVCVGEWFMHLHDPATMKEVRVLYDTVSNSQLGASVTAFAFTPDESRLAVGMGHRAAVWVPGDEAAKPVLLRGHGRTLKAIGFLPGGRTVLTAGMDGTVRIWDANTGVEVRSFDWGIGKLQAAAVSPDGTLCAAGGDDGSMVVWDVDP